MNYDYGTQFGYDQISGNPLADVYDAPYTQLPKIIKDQQYQTAADAGELERDASRVVYVSATERKKEKSRRPRLSDTHFRKSDVYNMFIVLLIIVIVMNTVKIQMLKTRMDLMLLSKK